MGRINAYALFIKEMSAYCRKRGQRINFIPFSRQCAKEWRSMSAQAKAKYFRKARRSRSRRYRKKYRHYRRKSSTRRKKRKSSRRLKEPR